jgi:hypothetical protein
MRRGPMSRCTGRHGCRIPPIVCAGRRAPRDFRDGRPRLSVLVDQLQLTPTVPRIRLPVTRHARRTTGRAGDEGRDHVPSRLCAWPASEVGSRYRNGVCSRPRTSVRTPLCEGNRPIRRLRARSRRGDTSFGVTRRGHPASAPSIPRRAQTTSKGRSVRSDWARPRPFLGRTGALPRTHSRSTRSMVPAAFLGVAAPVPGLGTVRRCSPPSTSFPLQREGWHPSARGPDRAFGGFSVP